jgi:hypothetical protein
MTQILTNPGLFPNDSLASTPSNATCYSTGEDAYVDSPISCVGNPPSAYYLRTWVCCAGAGGIPVGGCNQTGAVINSPNVNAGEAVCLVQVEVTWPTEPAGAVATAPWTGGFAENVFTTVPPLTFTNHIYMSMVREQ